MAVFNGTMISTGNVCGLPGLIPVDSESTRMLIDLLGELEQEMCDRCYSALIHPRKEKRTTEPE